MLVNPLLHPLLGLLLKVREGFKDYCCTLACRQLAAGYQSRHKKPVEPSEWPHGFIVLAVLDE
jgi:hypothetical protein